MYLYLSSQGHFWTLNTFFFQHSKFYMNRFHPTSEIFLPMDGDSASIIFLYCFGLLFEFPESWFCHSSLSEIVHDFRSENLKVWDLISHTFLLNEVIIPDEKLLNSCAVKTNSSWNCGCNIWNYFLYDYIWLKHEKSILVRFFSISHLQMSQFLKAANCGGLCTMGIVW